MMKRLILAGAGCALLLVAGCGRGDENPGGVTAKERQELDNAAALIEDSQTFDTSADSLTLNEASVPPAGNAQMGNAATAEQATANEATAR
jgi:hypothetical protein